MKRQGFASGIDAELITFVVEDRTRYHAVFEFVKTRRKAIARDFDMQIGRVGNGGFSQRCIYTSDRFIQSRPVICSNEPDRGVFDRAKCKTLVLLKALSPVVTMVSVPTGNISADDQITA